jgi:hypothetical protein
MLKFPQVREFGANIFTYIPLPLSKYVYRVMRQYVFKDNLNRVGTFDAAFAEVAKKTKQVNYLEFGCGRGTSLITAYDSAVKNGVKARLFAFDSFQGLPSSEANVFVKGEYAYPRQHLEMMTAKAGVPKDRLFITPGFYNQSLTPELYKTLDLHKGVYCVHIDCDLYESAKDVLNWILPLLDSGSVIIFDDWFAFDALPDPENYGEKKAFREYPDYSNWKLLYEKDDWNIAFVKV